MFARYVVGWLTGVSDKNGGAHGTHAHGDSPGSDAGEREPPYTMPSLSSSRGLTVVLWLARLHAGVVRARRDERTCTRAWRAQSRLP